MGTNLKVKSNYPLYLEILAGEKIAVSSPISLRPKVNNVHWMTGFVGLQHSASIDLKLIAEKSKISSTHYGIKIKASDFCEQPIMRFDADGVAHRNDFDDVPLSERQVTTPHFHKFNSEGLEWAYKTSVLKNPQQAAAIQNDINFGMVHFSNEGNVRYGKNTSPQVVERQAEMFSGLTVSDPLAGLSF